MRRRKKPRSPPYRGSEIAGVTLGIEVNLMLARIAIVALGLLAAMSTTACGRAAAGNESQMVRLAKLVIDPTQVDAYKAALQEEVEASVKLEPGVLTLYAVSEKDRPTHFTILEIYADRAAYEKHLKTPHFLKYKAGTEHMVKSLELVETVPLVPEMKIK
jgi:quinol monooxygenase YgiN